MPRAGSNSRPHNGRRTCPHSEGTKYHGDRLQRTVQGSPRVIAPWLPFSNNRLKIAVAISYKIVMDKWKWIWQCIGSIAVTLRTFNIRGNLLRLIKGQTSGQTTQNLSVPSNIYMRDRGLLNIRPCIPNSTQKGVILRRLILII